MRISDWSSDVCSSDLPLTSRHSVYLDTDTCLDTPPAAALGMNGSVHEDHLQDKTERHKKPRSMRIGDSCFYDHGSVLLSTGSCPTSICAASFQLLVRSVNRWFYLAMAAKDHG